MKLESVSQVEGHFAKNGIAFHANCKLVRLVRTAIIARCVSILVSQEVREDFSKAASKSNIADYVCLHVITTWCCP